MTKFQSAILLASAVWIMIVATMALEAKAVYLGTLLLMLSFALFLMREGIKDKK